ncbi:MAG: hypothetical protein JWO44_1122 [Bacteroidetes bacterium]|nr:hypothetical protein [Bacteroidota bacterium]
MKEYHDQHTKENLVQRRKDHRLLLMRMEEEEDEFLQAKSSLEIGAANDAYEQEADATAKKVVYGDHATAGINSSAPNVQMKKEGEEENTLMAKSENGTLKGTEMLQTKLDSSKGSGTALNDTVKNEMGGKMGADLSSVKIHTDSKAHEMSEGINAKAFTHGQDIYFKQGNYDTNSNEGKELLAHELTHTVQQSGGLKRKIQRTEDLSAVRVLLKAFMLAQPTTWMVKGLLGFWSMFPEEERTRLINAALDKKIGELKQQEKGEPPTWIKVISAILSGGGMSLSPVPSMETMWPLIINGELGYYEYLRNLSNPFIKQEGAAKSAGAAAGKTSSTKAPVTAVATTTTTDAPAGMKKNPDYKKGGYAKLLEHQLENMIDPEFMLGQIAGVFVGIYDWFKDIVIMIWDLLKFIWESIESAWQQLKDMLTFATTGKPPQYVTDIMDSAKAAGLWLKENGKMLIEFIVHLIKNPDARAKLGADIKAAVFGGAKALAKTAGAAVAKTQADFMSAPAYDQGMTMGKVVGYLIPEIVLAVFSGSIGNWIKAGLKAFQTSRAAIAIFRGAKWLVEIGRAVLKAFGRIGDTIIELAGGIFKKLGESFKTLLEFFKKLMKWGDEMPAPKKLGKGEELADNLGWPKPEPSYKWVDRGDGVPNYERTSKYKPEREYEPVKKEFRDKPVKERKQPKKNYQKVSGYEKATFGSSTSRDYAKTFTNTYPKTQGKVVVHHAVEQDILEKFPNLISESEMHSIENLRGIPKEINPDIHLSQIRKEWNRFYKDFPKPTKQELLNKATEIDNKFGYLFDPPIR